MIAKRSKRARRSVIRALILAVLLLSTLALSVHATPILDRAERGVEQAGDAVGNMAREAEGAMDEMARDATDGDGRVEDGDGMIGNEENASDDGMGRLGQVALLVVIAAAIIAIIMIVVLVPKRKRR